MDVFDYLAKKLRDTFVYFKHRTKAKYEGDRFESWVVANSNIQKNPKQIDGSSYWRLLEWRGDNFESGWYALSNLSPDLILQRNNRSKSDLCIAVECKYRNQRNFFLKKEQIMNYEEYLIEQGSQIKVLYYIFGFGWEDDQPKEVYLIPSTAIYTFDRGTREVRFLKSVKYEDYQVLLDRSIGKYYIQYKEKQSNC